jgi:hypothetical protein
MKDRVTGTVCFVYKIFINEEGCCFKQHPFLCFQKRCAEKNTQNKIWAEGVF